MAPKPKHPSPPAQMFDLLVAARRDGVKFEAAWLRAVRPGLSLVLTTERSPPEGAIRWPTDTATRVLEQAAIAATKPAWRRAYERRPASAQERAVTVLLSALTPDGGYGDRERFGWGADEPGGSILTVRGGPRTRKRPRNASWRSLAP